MFDFLKKDPSEKLQKQYENLLEQAMNHQRKGDIKAYSELSEQAEKVMKKINELDSL